MKNSFLRIHLLLGIMAALGLLIPVITGEYKHFYFLSPIALLVIIINYRKGASK